MTALLAVQIWGLYCICNEKVKSLAEVWVEKELRLTFRRTFSVELGHVGRSLLWNRWNGMRILIL
jgi:hypothetical protein